jgi:carboxypeptidase PM20D1
MKRILLVSLTGVALLLAVLLVRALRFASKQLEVEPVTGIAVDAEGVAQRLAAALRIETVSHQDSAAFDAEEFRRFHAFLEQSFPTVHATLAKETVGEFSLLFRWAGTDEALKPILLMAHMDVVPVEPGTESEWTHPAFAGRIAEGYVWGRGALDDKGNLVAELEAIETLLSEGFQPRRTLYLAKWAGCAARK